MRQSRAGEYWGLGSKTINVPPATWAQQKALNKRKQSMKHRPVTRRLRRSV